MEIKLNVNRLNTRLQYLTSKMRSIWDATATPRSHRTGRLGKSLSIKYKNGSIIFEVLNVPYARYQDEGTLKRRVSTPKRELLWSGKGVRGRGIKKNGGIKPANFTDPILNEKNKYIDIIKDEVKDAMKIQLKKDIKII